MRKPKRHDCSDLPIALSPGTSLPTAGKRSPGQLNSHHWGFDDPAHATGTEDEQMAVFRRVRDKIRKVFEAYAAGRRDAR